MWVVVEADPAAELDVAVVTQVEVDCVAGNLFAVHPDERLAGVAVVRVGEHEPLARAARSRVEIDIGRAPVLAAPPACRVTAPGEVALTAVELVVATGSHRELATVLAGVADRPGTAAVELRHLQHRVDDEPGAVVDAEFTRVPLDGEVVTVGDTGLGLFVLVVVLFESAVVRVERQHRYPEVAVEHDRWLCCRVRLPGVVRVRSLVCPLACVPVRRLVVATL